MKVKKFNNLQSNQKISIKLNHKLIFNKIKNKLIIIINKINLMKFKAIFINKINVLGKFYNSKNNINIIKEIRIKILIILQIQISLINLSNHKI